MNANLEGFCTFSLSCNGSRMTIFCLPGSRAPARPLFTHRSFWRRDGNARDSGLIGRYSIYCPALTHRTIAIISQQLACEIASLLCPKVVRIVKYAPPFAPVKPIKLLSAFFKIWQCALLCTRSCLLRLQPLQRGFYILPPLN